MAHETFDDDTTGDDLQRALEAKAIGAFMSTDTNRTLFEALLDAARDFGSERIAVDDAEGNRLTYQRLVIASLVLGKRLIRGTEPGEAIGIMLPNVTGLVVALLGLNAFGRVAALLNFTAGPRNLLSAVKTAPARKIITSRRFIEQAKLENVVAAFEKADLGRGKRIEIVYLEDVRASIGAIDKAGGAVRALRARAFHRARHMKPGSPAVILFTSGTEGMPKGVVLSNRNLLANSGQIFAHANGYLSSGDTVVNPLPLFHSFGLTAATLMPLFNGMRIVLYPSPLHYKQIPKLIRRTKASVLFATDTFLQGYARAAEPGDLSTLRFVVAGAERVKEATRRLWSDLGIDIQEGYGATECAPVIACNLPPINEPGTVGPPLPGLELKLTRVEGIEDAGRLSVRGPNVMMGYLHADNPGVIVPPEDGWHDTGDIVSFVDGRIIIKGRAKRFAKIGSEMVSLAAVETLASSTWPDAQHVVVSLPDERKGEQLVLVTDKPNADKASLLEKARATGFPELWVPKAVMVVGAIPVLGSGKIDLPSTLNMVRQARALL